MIFSCNHCGNNFKKPPCKRQSALKFCSKKCMLSYRTGKNHPNYGKKLRRVKKYTLSAQGLKKRQLANKNRIITPEYREKLKNRPRPAWIFLRGKANPNWKEDKSRTDYLMSLRGLKEMSDWRESVFKRDNYTCQHCGDSRGGNLEAHHIKAFAVYPELGFDINNGITLCKSCHKLTDNWGVKSTLKFCDIIK